MQPYKKSVKLFVDCLFSIVGSGKPFAQISTKYFTPKDVNFRLLILVLKFTRFHNRENKSQKLNCFLINM